MAARVELLISERFNVLNRITWRKHDGTYNEGGLWSRADKSKLRRYFEQKEEIIFAEHYGSDGYAKGEVGYTAKCDELRGFVFEPLRDYIKNEWMRAGLNRKDMNKAVGSSLSGGGMASHYIGDTGQWALPTKEHYLALREYAANHNHGGEYLRREYEDLRREYEDLRRPFNVTPDVPYTDVWTFPTVNTYPGKHPCEKPAEMIEHIIMASSKKGGTVLDSFMGSGVVGAEAQRLGRSFIGIEIDDKYFEIAKKRIHDAEMQLRLI